MYEKKVVKLLGLLEDIEEVNKMIQIHSLDTSDSISDFMLIQYKSKRDKLLGYLIDELVEPNFRSPRSFSIIIKLLEKQYPNLKKDAKKDTDHKFLEELELKLA